MRTRILLLLLLFALGARAQGPTRIFFTQQSGTASLDQLKQADLSGVFPLTPTTLAADAANFAQPTDLVYDEVNNYIYLVDALITSGPILRYNVDPMSGAVSNRQVLVTGTSSATYQGLTLDPDNNRLYFSQSSATNTLDAVKMVDLSGVFPLTPVQVAVGPDFQNPNDMVFDKIHDYLYVIDQFIMTGAILRYTVAADGTLSARTEVVAATGVAATTYGGLAVDLAGTKIYFTQYSTGADATLDALKVATMGASTPYAVTQLANGAANFVQPTDLVLDRVNNYLYVADQPGAGGPILRYDINGSNRQVVINATASTSYGGVALNGGFVTPLTLASSTPADNATGVATNTNIVLTFDRAAIKGSGNFEIVRTSDNVVLETIAVGSAQVTGSGATWTIDPSITLAQSTTYALRAAAGIFTAADLGSYAGIADNTTLNFTTVVPPTTVTAIDRVGGTPTNASSVDFNVTFAQSITGLTTSNFTLVTTGVSGASVTSVTPVTGSQYTVTVNTGSGSGTVGLNMSNDAGLSPTISNLPFTGQVYTIDKTAPAAPVVTAPANGSLTNDSTPSYSGTAEAGITVNVIVDGSSVGTTTATGGGSWSFTQPVILAEGSHNVKATATDALSNTSADSNTNTFTVDTTPPAVPVVVVPANGSTTNDNTPAYSGTAVAGITVNVIVDGSAIGTTTATGGGSWAFTQLAALADGSHTVRATATDAANNTSADSNINTFTVDATPPAAPVVVAPANGSSTNDNTPAYSGTAVAGSTIDVIVDGSSVGTTTADGGGSWSFTQVTTLAEGSHTVRATASDANGNTSASSNTNTFTVDTVAPGVTISSTATSPTSTSPIPVTVTFTQSVNGFVAGDVVVGNGTLSGFGGSGSIYTFNVTPGGTGLVTVNVAANVAQDAASNGNTAATQYSVQYNAPILVSNWTGNVSTNWFTAGNWTMGVPTATLDGLIPAGRPRYPVLSSSTATARNLSLNSGGTLTQSGGTLDLKGNLSNNGTFNASGGTVSLTSAAAQTVGGSSLTRFWNLTVGAAGATLTGAAAVQRLLVLTGNLTTAGNTFTLQSTADVSAMVVNSGGVVNGIAKVQRAIDPILSQGLGYRQYSSPVAGSNVADLATAGFTPVVNPAYNTAANPSKVNPYPNVFGYDQSRVATASNNLLPFDKGWYSPTALTDALTVGRGYLVNIRANQVVDFQGMLNNGNYSLALARNSGPSAASSGWHQVGNPYPAPLDYSLVAPADRANLDGAMYVFETLTQYLGYFRVYINGLGCDPLLAVGQGFFVRVRSGQTSGSLTFRNSQRLTSYQNPTFHRGQAESRPLVQLMLRDQAGASDEAYVYFEQGATAEVDLEFDAVKLPNPSGLNLASLVGTDEAMAINGLPVLNASDVSVPLQIAVPATGSYTLDATQLRNLPAGTQAYLRDRQTGALVDLSQQPSYSFTQNVAFTGARFELLLSSQRVPTTTATSLSAQILVYPNPASKSVWVELPATLGRAAVTVTLVDALGRPVLEQVLPAAGAKAHQVPLLSVATGVYSVHVRTEQGSVIRKLLVE